MSPLRAATTAIVAGLLLAGCGPGSGEAQQDPAPGSGEVTDPATSFEREAPNVVVVMTDDQALDTMRAMPRTRRLVGGEGVTFDNAVVSYPLCCPSRATFLTGQYSHNTGVLDNKPPNGGIGALDQERTIAVALQEAGYRTAFVGKYLNGYAKGRNGGPEYVPPGWSEWYAMTNDNKTGAYDYAMNENGELVRYGDRPADYKGNVLIDHATRVVRRNAGRRPFFLWVATSAPHTDNRLPRRAPRNPIPAPRDRGSWKGTPLPRPPSFNSDDVEGKPPLVTERERFDPDEIERMERLWVSQLESLGAVDRLVAGVAGELRRAGELENTLIMFTSDHGFLRGQHRFDSGKSLIYEESILVPLLVRGPGFPAGERHTRPVANVDLAPTILRAAGAEALITADGVPLQRSVRGASERDGILVEIRGRRGGDVIGVRTDRWILVRYDDGFEELYDLREDPHQLDNLAEDPDHAEVRDRLGERIEELRDCSGAECRS